MAKMDEFISFDATGLAALVRQKQVKAIELIDASIERIERLNPTLNAVVTPMYEQAREAAAGEFPDGPFSGVPFLLKDLGAPCVGVRMTMGSAFMRNFVPDHDNELVARLKRAGFIIVGKTNTPELGILPTTEPRLFGPSRNPWDISRTPGGSSGGRRRPWLPASFRWLTAMMAEGQSGYRLHAVDSSVLSRRGGAIPLGLILGTFLADW